MSRKNDVLYFGGVPTAPDVAKIMNAIGVPAEGDTIEWVRLESITGCTRDSSRYASIVHAWRRKLWTENNLLLIAVAGVGLKVANPAERIEAASKKAKHGKKAIMVASVIADRTDANRLTSPQKETRAMLADVPARLRLLAEMAYKPQRKIA